MTEDKEISKKELKRLRTMIEQGQKLSISTKEFEKVFDEIERLEQERNELQDKYSKLIHKYNDLYEKYRAKEILEPDLKEEIKRFDALSIKYSQALEEIRKIADNVSDTFDTPMVLAVKIQNKINEVLNEN